MAIHEPTELARQHRARATAALDVGRYAIAEESAKKAIAAVPSDGDARLILARALLSQDRHAEADLAAEEAVRLKPNDAYAHYLLGFIRNAHGRSMDALAPLRESVRLNSSARRYKLRLAIALFDCKQSQEALTLLNQAATLASDDHFFIDECARLFSLTASHDQAEVFAARALALAPNDPLSHWRLSWVLANAKRDRDAIVCAFRALRVEPNYSAAWEELGYCYRRLGEDNKSLVCYYEALRLRPTLVTATINVVTIHRGAQRPLCALEVLSKTLQLKPQDAELLRLKKELDQELARTRENDWLARLYVAMGMIFSLLYGIAASDRRLSLVCAGVSVALALLLRNWWQQVMTDDPARFPPSRQLLENDRTWAMAREAT